MELKEENIEANSASKYECSNCAMTFESKSTRYKHIRKIHQKKTFYKCDICEKVYSKVESIKRHIIYLHGRLRVKCELCDKTFGEPRIVKSHMERVHDKITRHKCLSCEKGFYDLKDLRIHFQSVHEKSGNFECKICNMKYNSQKS